MPACRATSIVPADDDLPGDGWLAIDEGFGGEEPSGTVVELFDCVGPGFPEDDVVDTAASPHFVHLPRRLIHGIGVAFSDDGAALQAETILRGAPFAECLGRSVAADLDAKPVDTELLAIDVAATEAGHHRVSFTGGDEHGVRPVHLDIAVLRIGTMVGLLWCGDTPDPFPAEDLTHVVARIRTRLGV